MSGTQGIESRHMDPCEQLQFEFQRVFAKAKLPTSPTVASRLLELIKDTTSSISDFGNLIRTDPALTARLLKTANSVVFAQRTRVSTIERAVAVLGLEHVKTLCLGFQLVSHLDKLGDAPFDMQKFWQHSLLRACLGQSLARAIVPAREEEAFLVGLLQECGVLLLVQVLGVSYAGLFRAKLSPTAFHAVERETFSYTHVDAIAAMAQEWRLPEDIAAPLRRHHDRLQLSPESDDAEKLVGVSYYINGLCFDADFRIDPGDLALKAFGEESLGLDDPAWNEVQNHAKDAYRSLVMLYEDIVPDSVDVAELLNEANRLLSQTATEADQRIANVQSERDAVLREQEVLARAVGEYRERAALDPLTQLLNRGALAEGLQRILSSQADQGRPIGLLFIDLDNFKRLNDTDGHTVGDTILKAVADTLREEVGSVGTVARYGGEELVVLAEVATADDLRHLAQRILDRVRGLDAVRLGASQSVTCSIGAYWGTPEAEASPDELIRQADRLMYEAKRLGKNRCVFKAALHGRGPDGAVPATASGSATPQDATGAGADGIFWEGLEELRGVARQLNAQPPDECVALRKEHRKELVTPCSLHYFTGRLVQVRSVRGVTRNVSSGGAGIVTTQALSRGEPVELEIATGASTLYLAGLVSSCRPVDRNVYEMGIQFVVQSLSPGISGDAARFLQHQGWAAQSLQQKQQGQLAPDAVTQ